MTTFDQALDAVIVRTGHARFRDLCDPQHPDYRPAYRERVVALYGEQVEGFAVVVAPCDGCGDAPTPATLGQQIASASRAAAGFVASGGAVVAGDVYRARLETCRACEHLSGSRCELCGCIIALKAKLPAEACPIGKWTAAADQSVT